MLRKVVGKTHLKGACLFTLFKANMGDSPNNANKATWLDKVVY